ncbi:TonB-dependent receptor [Exilibacterium tricleocarpae]|uniref:TonB-dependent receptor n=1 Tax=Exilibacterium tricleocarpae TaxID=2591008 RepID=A0A545TZP9_9GAMM|nr:TonB-dependent receptor [Exilibacterium tricleocarpae]TQV82689.1 TonB-dependent receptor [Exilibacterium tricleocarpae]
MKKLTTPSVLASAITTTLLLSNPIQAQDGGIAGQVVYEGSEYPLKGAVVKLRELSLETTTGSDGRFRMPVVPDGNYTLIVDYLGVGSESHTVVVSGGQTAQAIIRFGGAGDGSNRDIEEVMVVGTLAGSRIARNKERAADNFKTVVSADALGQLADQNIAESLQRLPGLTVQRNEGEGRFVSVRGLSPDFNNVTINGVQVGGGGDGFGFSDQGGSRSVSLDVVPSDLLESIEVSKSRTADMDGDIIGGAIELKSLSAFDRGGFFADLRLEGSHNDIAGETSPKVSGRFTNIFQLGENGGELGVALAANWFDRDIQLDDLRTDNELRSVSTADSDENPAFLVPGELDPRVEVGTRERRGFTLNFDYRPNDTSEYHLHFTNTNLQDNDIRIQQNWDLDDARDDDELLEVGAGTGTFADVDIEKRIFFQDKENEVTTFALGGKNTFDRWTVEYGASHSKNEYELPDGIRGQFRVRDTITTFAIGERDYDISFVQGEGNGDRDPLRPDAFRLDQILVIGDERSDEITAYNLDFTRAVNFGATSGTIKFGMKYKTREKDVDRTRAAELNGDDDVAEALGLDPDADEFFTLADISTFSPNRSRAGFEFFPTLGAAESLFRSLIPATEASANPITTIANLTRRDYVAEEDVLAAYVMTKVDLTEKWRLTAGVRVEQTDWQGDAFEVERVERDDDSELEDETRDPIARQAKRDYTNVLPGVHLRYEPREDVVVRTALTTAIQRPAFNDTVPLRDILSDQQEVDDENSFEREVEVGNPDLDPLEALQFDASVAWYPTPQTLLSAGFFYKELDNFFIDARFDGEDVTVLGLPVGTGRIGADGGFDEVNITLNGGTAEVYGIELTYAHALASGFFIESNATWSDSEADPGQLLRDARGGSGDLPLPDQADLVGNLALGWENEAWTVRSSWTYRDEQLTDIASDPEEDVIRAEHLSWDIGIKYRLNDNYGFYIDLINLTEERDQQVFRGDGSRRYFERIEDYGRTYQLGVTVRW